MLTFNQTKEELLRKGYTFRDSKFPADKSSLGNLGNVDDVIWKRPEDLCEHPKFIVNGASRFDIVQGEIADCWFISAAACLAYQEPSLFKWCIPDQSFQDNYAGIFLFRFWEFGSWTEIYIDDRLPTRDGKLIFAQNTQETDEFWVPLFEKAYAKLKGNYSNLDGGQTTYALVDFTGGITEIVDVKAQRLMSGRLFNTMRSIIGKSSMMGCDILAKNGVIETELSNGLFSGHAYSISTIMNVPTILGTKVKLLRLRNPWGAGEWNGAWADGSRQWNSVSDSTKVEMQFLNMDEGEFWMSYDDWTSQFDNLTICHLEPRNITGQVLKNKGKTDWEVMSFHAEWIAGYNAGGSGRLSFKKDTFFTNPQFKLTILDPSPPSPTSLPNPTSLPSPTSPYSFHPTTSSPTVIISLMQLSRSWDEQTFIGFDIYKTRPGVEDSDAERKFSKRELIFAKTGRNPINVREATTRVDLIPGNYVVIPYTMERDVNAKFLLRIYTEEKVEDDKEFNTPTSIIPVKDPHFLEQQRLEKTSSELFQKFAPSEDMDATELLMSLDFNAKNDGWPGFTSLEAARCLVSVFGTSKPGFVNQEELYTILKDLQYWTDHFKKFDTDKSGTINCRELSRIYSSIGIQVSYRLTTAVVGKYAGRGGEVALDEFSLVSCKIKHTYDIFKKLSEEEKLKMDLEEWMSVALTM